MSTPRPLLLAIAGSLLLHSLAWRASADGVDRAPASGTVGPAVGSALPPRMAPDSTRVRASAVRVPEASSRQPLEAVVFGRRNSTTRLSCGGQLEAPPTDQAMAQVRRPHGAPRTRRVLE